MFVTSARQGREMGPGRGRCPPPIPCLNSFGKQKSAYVAQP